MANGGLGITPALHVIDKDKAAETTSRLPNRVTASSCGNPGLLDALPERGCVWVAWSRAIGSPEHCGQAQFDMINSVLNPAIANKKVLGGKGFTTFCVVL
ncbi:hypothetical protein BTVI_35756 [Pitangus sulphuratus]|nr:hypothetical protein BTVI_35756 [Pitangus sulphuratus]